MKRWNIVLYIFVICCILSIAILSPNIVSYFMQKSLDGKVSYVDVGVKTYEVKYNNIWEKIVSIEKCVEEDGKLETIPIATEVTEQVKDTLTQQVIQQTKLLQEGIICNFFDIRKEHLISCKKYAIYSSTKANGIQLWYLKYQNKGNTIQLVMDTEFNHIYRFQLSLSKGGNKLLEHYCIQLEKEGESGVTYSIYKPWLENLSSYFNIDSFRILYDYPDIYLLYKKRLPLYSNLYYETESNTNIYDAGNTQVVEGWDGMYDVDHANTMSLLCEYQWDEKGGLSLNWGFSFFNPMMQL